VRRNIIRTAVSRGSIQGQLHDCTRILVAAIAGWAVLVATELIVLFGALRVFAVALDPGLLPSLKVVLDMGALAACGWIAGRLGRPRVMTAAALTVAGLALADLTPYLPLNVPWVLRLTINAAVDTRYVSSLITTVTVHALMFGSLLAGAHLSRPRDTPVSLGVDR